MLQTLKLVRKALASEIVKIRRTFMIWFVVIVPVIVVFATFLTVLNDTALSVPDAFRWYVRFAYRPYLHVFVFLQILLAVHINYIEHRNMTWKNLFVLPAPRWSILLAKAIVLQCVLFLNVFIFYCLVMISGELMAILRPEPGFQSTGYWYEAFVPSVKFFLASSFITAIMYWLSYAVKSALASVIGGLIGYASGFAIWLITSRPTYEGFPWSRYHPFTLGGFAFDSFGTGNHALNMDQVYLGTAGALVIFTLHCFYSRVKFHDK